MRKIIIILALVPILLYAQEEGDSIATITLDEVVCVDSMWPGHRCEDAICLTVDTIDARDMWEKLENDWEPDLDYSKGSEKLSFNVYTLTFFRDNEYDSNITKGYSLPGVKITPAFVYDKKFEGDSWLKPYKRKNIHLELGAHALIFDGANKYPCYAYHDIGTWKGNQYQSGAHVLPWVRAMAQIDHFTVVLGDIYGDVNHGYVYCTPLYNNEQMLSADPEMGAQIGYGAKYFNGEAYINWQSYQFEEDTHQEAFTVGVGGTANTDNGRLLFPVRVLVQHRGGEQDLPELNLGVQTIANAAAGVLYYLPGIFNTPAKCGQIGANVFGCYQKSGQLWPFDSGLAFNVEGQALLGKYVTVKLGDFYAPDNFISIYGNPFFSTLSLKTGANYKKLNTAYLMTEFTYQIAKGYVFGANAELFKVNATGLNEFNFSFGLYLRMSPSFKIK